MQGRYADAFDAFYKAIWSAGWQHSGYFELARLACRDGRLEEALELVERSLLRNAHHHSARHLKIVLLRRLGCTDAAQDEIATALALDCMSFGALYEQHLLGGDAAYRRLMRENVHTMIEIALDYAHAGLFEEASAILRQAPLSVDGALLSGLVSARAGNLQAARAAFTEAALIDPTYCFPHQIECVPALECAVQINPQDARAPHYLGNFWYAHRRYEEAIECWERARLLDPSFPTTHRNLGLAYLNKQVNLGKALDAYRQAFQLDPTDARVFFELDQIYKRLKEPPQKRLERLEQHPELVIQRDDLMIERAALLNLLGRHEEALDLVLTHHFHPWEGGEGKVTGQYVISLIELAKSV
jgi:tetratricopeptide (TPR) repeat protein